MDKEKIICLDDEKIYGNNLNKLFIRININKVMNINDGDLIFLFLYNINISLLRLRNNLLYIVKIRLGIIHIEFGIIIIIINLKIQLICMLFHIDVDGSKILNKFVIIFNWFKFIRFNFSWFIEIII